MSCQKLRLLIVAAYAKELAPLCRLGSKHFVIKKNVAFLAAGIGPVAAAFGLTHFLEDYRPKLIIGIGTAGIINSKYKIGEVVVGKKVSVESKVFKKGSTFCPPCSLSLPRAQSRGLLCPELPSVSIYAPQEVSKTEVCRAQLAKTGHDVENLEAYAFAFVAKKFKIPFISILGLTNRVGPMGHVEWVRNEGRVCKKIALAVKKIMKS